MPLGSGLSRFYIKMFSFPYLQSSLFHFPLGQRSKNEKSYHAFRILWASDFPLSYYTFGPNSEHFIHILWDAFFANKDQVFISRFIHSFTQPVLCQEQRQTSVKKDQDPYHQGISIVVEKEKRSTGVSIWQDNFRQWQTQYRK